MFHSRLIICPVKEEVHGQLSSGNCVCAIQGVGKSCSFVFLIDLIMNSFFPVIPVNTSENTLWERVVGRLGLKWRPLAIT